MFLVSGLSIILLQIAIADFFLLGGIAGLGLWVQNAQTWSFGTIGCIVFRGFDVLTSTASSYLIVTLGLHILATYNVEEKAAKRRDKRACEDDEIRSSRHSLVASSDSSTPPRTMDIDYRIVDNKIRVTTPCIFIWILAVSLSIPEFIFATVLQLRPEVNICTYTEPSHRINMHSMLAIFNVYLPVIILFILCILCIMKLKSKQITFDVDGNQLVSALKLTLYLTVTYFLLCLPRSILTTYFVYSMSLEEGIFPLYELIDSKNLVKWNLATCCVYLIAGLCRPLLCILLLPRLRQVFLFRVNNV